MDCSRQKLGTGLRRGDKVSNYSTTHGKRYDGSEQRTLWKDRRRTLNPAGE